MGMTGAMRGWTAWTGLSAATVAVQAQAAVVGDLAGIRPELPLLPLAYLALHGRRETVLPGAVGVGFLVSLGTAVPPSTVLALHLGFALALLAVRGLVFREHPATEASIVLAAVAAYRLAGAFLVEPGGGLASWAGIPEVAASAGATALLAAFFFPVFRRRKLFLRSRVAARAG